MRETSNSVEGCHKENEDDREVGKTNCKLSTVGTKRFDWYRAICNSGALCTLPLGMLLSLYNPK